MFDRLVAAGYNRAWFMLVRAMARPALWLAVAISLAGAFSVPPPARADDPVQHRVQPGETLWSIAGRYGVPIDAIAAANGLADPNRIRAGDFLLIPTSPSPAAQPPAVLPAGPSTTYTVQAGDTFWGISRRLGIAFDDLLAANPGVDPNRIRVGQLLNLPADPAPPPQPPALPTDQPAPDSGTLVRVYYYCLTGRMASGQAPFEGAVAADWSVFPLGTRLRVDGLGEFTVLDRFGTDLGQPRLDVWVSSCAEALRRGVETRRVWVIGP